MLKTVFFLVTAKNNKNEKQAIPIGNSVFIRLLNTFFFIFKLNLQFFFHLTKVLVKIPQKEINPETQKKNIFTKFFFF